MSYAANLGRDGIVALLRDLGAADLALHRTPLADGTMRLIAGPLE